MTQALKYYSWCLSLGVYDSHLESYDRFREYHFVCGSAAMAKLRREAYPRISVGEKLHDESVIALVTKSDYEAAWHLLICHCRRLADHLLPDYRLPRGIS